MSTTTFINPFTDFGFKKLFGCDEAKPSLKSIIEDALNLPQAIVDLNFMNAEQLGAKDDERKAIFDVYCTTDDGSHFIVELQKAKQHFFKDRTVFYTSFPIRSQAQRGDWDYKLCPVYCLGILDFSFDDTRPKTWHHIVKLKNQKGDVFYDKLTYAFLELSKFRDLKKKPKSCKTHLERWCYSLIHMDDLNEIPEFLANDNIIEDTFKRARFAAMSTQEQASYEHSLKVYRDLTNVVNTAYDDGVAAMKEESHLAKKQAEEEKAKREESDRKAQESDHKAQEADRKAEEADRKAEEADRKAEEADRKAEDEKAKRAQADRKAKDSDKKAERLEQELAELKKRLGPPLS